MLHLNDHLYAKLMCLFVCSKFLVSHHRSHTPRHFYGLSLYELCLTTINGSFTRGGIYPCLLLPDTSFLYHIIQPCDSIGLRPTKPSSLNQTLNAVLIFQPCTHTHNAMSSCICNAMRHYMLYHVTCIMNAIRTTQTTQFNMRYGELS